MASFDDLGQALRDDADASAPPASRIDVDAVIAAARARRRPRQWGAGALGLVAVLGLGGIAVAAVAPPTLIAASESAGGDDLLLSEGGAVDEGVGAPTASGDERAARVQGCDGLPSVPGEGVSGLAIELTLPDGVSVVRVSGLSCADGTALPPGVYSVGIEFDFVDPVTGAAVSVEGPSLPLRLD